jgi:putative addiction module killer protein
MRVYTNWLSIMDQAYRIYYGKQGDVVVILLIGGEKKSQDRDIEKAYRYWLDYKGL